MDWTECPVCLRKDADFRDRLARDDWLHVRCPRCGSFHFHLNTWEPLRDARDASELGKIDSRKRANVSGYIRENPGLSIGPDDVHWLATRPAPTFHDRADKLLQALERRTEFAGKSVEIRVEDSEWLAIAWCLNDIELREVVRYLVAEKRVEHSPLFDSPPVMILPEGWAHLEQLRERGAATSQAFIAMNMVPDLDPLWRTLEAGIRAAGYSPFRIDRKLDTDKLDDEILAEIRRSKFLVADLTNQRPSVYLEIGYAMGLGMRVFRTCRADEIKEKKLAFDLQSFLCMSWELDKLDHLRKPLRDRIVRSLGEGPLGPPEILAFFYRNPEERRERYKVSHAEVGWPAQEVSLGSEDALRTFLHSARPQKIVRTGAPDSSGNSTLVWQPASAEAAFNEISALNEGEGPVRLMFFESDFRRAFLPIASRRA